ncbi:MAG: host-nuclease inhibitor Gam family protein [Deltaproteobacteria bacterium]|nr:host-nuclease inhibitor Gam family protein [Deltaproteobacteria bacterium]
MTEDQYKIADELLQNIDIAQFNIDSIEAEWNAVLKQLEKDYGIRLKVWQDKHAADEKALLALMKKGKGAIFDGRERVELKHGILIHGSEDRVKIPRNALELAEKQGLTEAIKVAKSIDREAVEKWPDERLILIGAERKPRDVYSYETRGK